MKFLLALLPMMSAFAAQPSQPGYLKDFDYQVASYDSWADAYSLEKLMSIETRDRSICSNRAHLWAYDLARFRNVKVGKVFLHFTEKSESDNNSWSYHVAPYVIVKGKEMVLDPVFHAFGGMPITLEKWTQHFAKSKNCLELDPVNNPEHLALEKFNLADDSMNPSDYSGGVRLYPSKLAKCYIRKVPMYYQYPAEVYGVDLYHSGKAEYASFEKWYFDDASVLNACQQAMNIKFKMKHGCADYLR
jgi:hypothetical protein